ncbi:MAG: response regulator [Euryarchaeota archaeon]|nr:response regulator [Euryarchaeota archaeon]
MARILIVDDSASIRFQLKEMLVKLGQLPGEIFFAEDGRIAMEKFAEVQPEWVFMDISMPNQDGVATTEAMLAQQPELRVIVLTGLRREDPQSMRLIMQGAFAFLSKPLEMEDIRKVIKKLEEGLGGAGRIMGG